jgi:hypothetical protein
VIAWLYVETRPTEKEEHHDERRHDMRNMMLLGTVAALITMVTLPAAAQDKPGVVVADLIVATATVEAVDHAKRTGTLKGLEGHTRTLKVDKAVRNFDQVQKGDQVMAEYYEETAILVRPSVEPPTAGEVGVVEVAPRGAKPGVADVETRVVTAKVEAIDPQKRTVTLRGPQGNVVTLKVDEQAKKFDQVKVGDEVVVRHTEAVAITVQKP